MDTKRKYWLIYGITAVIVMGILGAILGLFWSDLGPEERRMAEHLAPKLAAYALTGMIVNLVLFGSLLATLFKVYIDPLVKLRDETELIAVANAKYRIVPEGGREVVALIEVLNELADKHIALKTDVQQIVQLSKTGLAEEKRRLETLMSQVPQGVVVCNVDGRVLLYNHQAAAIVGAPSDQQAVGAMPLLGLGRSVFGVLDRSPILHALNYLQNRLDEGATAPTFDFTTSLRRERFVRVRMAPVVSGKSSEIDGYVLTLEDITARMQADARRDIFLQSLTLALTQELDTIRAAVTALERDARLQVDPLAAEVRRIGASSSALSQQIDDVALSHAYRLQDPGQAEHILGADLMSVLCETLSEEFGLEVESRVDADVWLNVNSYTVMRGVLYLVGQLVNLLAIERVELGLEQVDRQGYLTVRWKGDAVAVRTIEQWKQCPLVTRARQPGPVSLENLLADRGDISSSEGGDETAVAVRFRLEVEQPESKWTVELKKKPRPLFYEMDLFDAGDQRRDLDDRPLAELVFVVFDTETTGLDPSGGDEIISIGGIRVVRGKLRREEVFEQLVDPRRSIPLESLKIHEIYPEMLRGMPLIDEVLPRFHRFAEGAVLVAHNAAFDMKFLELKQEAAGLRFDHPVLDTLLLSALANPSHEGHNLDDVAERLGLPVVGRHTALGDAILTAEVLLLLLPLLAAKGIHTLGQAREASQSTQYSSIRF